jgi:predicted alpha/beta hydrolase
MSSDPSIVPHAALLWLPALGVPARKYQRLASHLAGLGIASHLHEWRGTGEHPARASRRVDWGYRELLLEDIPQSIGVLRERHPGLPLLLGGHSIGAQFAVLAAALHGGASGLVAIGSGVPHWRHFAPPLRWLIAGFGHVLPPLTRAVGYYPGEQLRFAGREAGQLMRDWAQTVRRGHYDGLRGLPGNVGERLAALELPFLGLRLSEDRLVPAASLRALVATTRSLAVSERVLDADALGTRPDHFSWMRDPPAVAGEIAAWWAEASARRAA